MLTTIICCLLIHVLHGQEGIVITETDSIKGEVRVSLEQDQVVVKKGNIYSVLSAKQVKEITAVEKGQQVRYFSARYGAEGKSKLFRVISHGRLNLVFRQGIVKNKAEGVFYPDLHVFVDGEIVQSLSSEKDILRLLKDRKEEIKGYLSKNIFYADDQLLVKELFDYYNGL
jgi:hypothetical protein